MRFYFDYISPYAYIGEPFWGVDALDLLDGFLADREPVPADLVARWDALPASAQRRTQ